MISYSSISLSIDFLTIILSGVLMLNNWKRNKSIIYLGLFLIISALYIIATLFFNFGGNIYIMAVLTNNIAPSYFLLGPLYYFFVRGMTRDDHKLKKIDIIHFIPFFISLIQVIPYWFTSFEYKIYVSKLIIGNFEAYRNIDFGYFYPHLYNIYARSVLLMIYGSYSLYMIIKSWKKEKNKHRMIRPEFKNVYHGLYFITIIVLIVSLTLIVVSRVLVDIKSMDEGLLTNLKYVVRSILGVYLLIPLYLIVNPKLTHNFEIVYSKLENEKNNQQLDISIIGMKIEQNSNMDEPENEKYIQLSHEIMEYLKVNKPFLRPDFKAHDICTELNIPRHHVQYIINQILKTNFADLKNKLRIEYALDLLKDNTTKNMSLEGIGQKSGFTSNSNFYKIFKDVTGLTPSQWAKENGNNKV